METLRTHDFLLMDAVQEIKSRLSIEEVVADYVQLKKAGRNLKGLCPFHQEKSPSFMVSPEKQIAYCFGCHKGGDIFKFLMEVENLDFREALVLLANKAGVTLPDSGPTTSKDEKSRLFELNKLAAEFYYSLLLGKEGEQARKYLEQRGLRDETWKEWQLGVSLGQWDLLVQHLKKKGFTEEDMVQAGLAIMRDQRRDGAYDRFRSRLMFPLIDTQGRVIGFSGRTLVGADPRVRPTQEQGSHEPGPKYLNSPETPIFHKSNYLFGLYQGKSAIKELGQTVVVEGQMDVITLHQAGIRNVVATSGTALTPQHIIMLARLGQNIAFAFDTDTAGVLATKRALQLALTSELNAQVLVLPAGKDPDEFVRDNPSGWSDVLKSAINWITFYFNTVFQGQNLSEIQTKKGVAKELLSVLSGITNNIEQEVYLREISTRLGISERTVYLELARLKQKHTQKTETEKPLTRRFSREEYLLGLLLNFPALGPKTFDKITDFDIFSQEYRGIYKGLKKYYNELTGEPNLTDYVASIDSSEKESSLKLLQFVIGEKYADTRLEIVERELELLVAQLKLSHQKEQLHHISIELKRIESIGDVVKRDELLQQQRAILGSRKS